MSPSRAKGRCSTLHIIEDWVPTPVMHVGSVVKKSTYQYRRWGFDPWLRRSSGGGNVNLFQYSFLENSMDRGAWLVIVHRSQRVQHDWACKQECTSILQLTACSNIYLGSSASSLWDFGNKENGGKMLIVTLLAMPWVIKLALTKESWMIAYMKLWQANTFVCKLGKMWDPSQLLASRHL